VAADVQHLKHLAFLCAAWIETVFEGLDSHLRPLLGLDVSLNYRCTHITSSTAKVAMRPQGRQFKQMRKFFTQYSRGSTFERPHNLMRRFSWRGLDKQVNVVRLNRQSQNSPSTFVRDFFTDFAQANSDSVHQHFLASFRYPDKVIAHLIDRVIRSFDFIRLHVDSLTHIDTESKGNVRFHPSAKAQGFPAPESYNG